VSKIACTRFNNGFPFAQIDDSDSEGECALSENWMFQRESRRWSRVDDIVNTMMQQPPPSNEQQQQQPQPQQQQQQQQQAGGVGGNVPSLQPAVASADGSDGTLASRFRRSGSERLRDGAKAILRRVESLKTRRRKLRNRDGVVIGSPQVRLHFSRRFFVKSLCRVNNRPDRSLGQNFPSASVTWWLCLSMW